MNTKGDENMISKKKITTILLTGTLAITALVSGCGKKNIDYGKEGSPEDSVNADQGSNEGGLAGRLGIPESCEVNIDVGNTGLESIKLKDDAIELPDADSMSVVYYEAMNIDEAYKQKLVETFFDQDQGVYAYDPEHPIRSEIEEEIEHLRTELENMDPGDEVYTWYSDRITELEIELQDAPEEYPLIEDYSGHIFLGSRNGYKYGLVVNVGEESTVAPVNGGLLLYDGISYRPYEDAQEVYCEYGPSAETYAELNLCHMTQDEAVAVAEDFLAEHGVTDMVLSEINVMEWSYYDSAGEEINTEYDGYVVEFCRGVHKTAAYGCELMNLDSLMQKVMWINISPETYSVFVDDNGVVQAYWTMMFESTGEEDPNATLLSWDELITAANTNIAKYYEEYPTQYKKIEFNDVRLSYYPVIDEEKENSYKYIPVWVFSQYEEYIDEDGSKEPSQLVIINAMDGTVLDLIELAQTFGTYMEWY